MTRPSYRFEIAKLAVYAGQSYRLVLQRYDYPANLKLILVNATTGEEEIEITKNPSWLLPSQFITIRFAYRPFPTVLEGIDEMLVNQGFLWPSGMAQLADGMKYGIYAFRLSQYSMN